MKTSKDRRKESEERARRGVLEEKERKNVQRLGISSMTSSLAPSSL
jgi:hypothetical protein